MVNNVKTESLKVQIVFFFIFSCLIFRREKKKKIAKSFFPFILRRVKKKF